MKRSVECECAHCGKHITRTLSQLNKSKSGRVFCSRSCAASYNNSEYRTGENNPNWIDGAFRGKYYINVAFRAYKAKCSMCGLDEECCLEVHHVDGDRSNNTVNNLIILCANCHSRIHRGGYKITEQMLNNRELV